MAQPGTTEVIETETPGVSSPKLVTTTKTTKNVIVMAVMIVFALMIIYSCARKSKNAFRIRRERTDPQSDWSIDKELNAFISRQDELIQKYKREEAELNNNEEFDF